MRGRDRHLADAVVDEVEHVARTVDAELRGILLLFEDELLFDAPGRSVDAVETGFGLPVFAAGVAAVGQRPQFAVAVDDQRIGLDAPQFDFVHHLVLVGVDDQDLVAVRPAVDEDPLVVLRHLFRGVVAARRRSLTGVDGARYLAGAGVEDGDVGAEQVGHVGFRVAQEVDVARRDDVVVLVGVLAARRFELPLDAEGVGVDGPDHARIVHRDEDAPFAQEDRLRHVAQFGAVGTVEYLVLHRACGGVVVGERGVAGVHVAFAEAEDPRAAARVEILFFSRPRTFAGCQQQYGAPCGRYRSESYHSRRTLSYRTGSRRRERGEGSVWQQVAHAVCAFGFRPVPRRRESVFSGRKQVF